LLCFLSIGYKGVLSLGVKCLGLEADHQPPTSAEVKKKWVCDSLPHTSPWHGTLLVKQRHNFAAEDVEYFVHTSLELLYK
jgi:hypothetical protein